MLMISTTRGLLLPSSPSTSSPSPPSPSSWASISPTGRKSPPSPCAQSFYLCLSCFGQALYVVLLNPISIHNIQTQFPDDNTSGYCIFEGILKATFDLSSIIWTTLIIYSIFASVIQNRSLESYEVIYLLIGFLVPLVGAIIPAIFHLYGYNVYFCWFKSTRIGLQFWLKMGFFYIPLWVAFIVNLVLSIITYRKLIRLGLDERDLIIFKRLMLFPFILFITGIFATVNSVYVYLTGHFVAWLQIIGIIMLSFYGFFNALAYGFNPIIRDKIERCFVRGGEQDEMGGRSETSRDTERLEAELFSVDGSKKGSK